MLYISPPLAPKVDYVVTDTLNGVDNSSQMLCVRLDSLYKGKVMTKCSDKNEKMTMFV